MKGGQNITPDKIISHLNNIETAANVFALELIVWSINILLWDRIVISTASMNINM